MNMNQDMKIGLFIFFALPTILLVILMASDYIKSIGDKTWSEMDRKYYLIPRQDWLMTTNEWLDAEGRSDRNIIFSPRGTSKELLKKI